MKKSEETYKTIFNNLPDIYYETDLDGKIIIINPSITKYTGYKPEECIDKNITLLFTGNKYKSIFIKTLLEKESISNYEIQLTDKQGKIHHSLISANIIKDSNGNITKITGLIKDICDLKAKTEELYQFATYDELTGVYNRRVGMEFLKQELKKMRRVKTFLSICFIDINDLKIVNDNFGHDAGDNLILAIVEDIKSAMRESDILSRIGGDEFLLIFPGCKLDEVKSIWRRVQKSIKERNKRSDNEYIISASYGFAETNSENILYIDELIQIADKKMYAHKRRTKIENLNKSPFKVQ